MKMNVFFKLFSLSLLVSSLIDARSKSVKPAKAVTTQAVNKQAKDISLESITFDYSVFTAKDCKKHLNVKDLIKKGFQPIQITITNNSSNTISISAENFNLRTSSVEKIADVLYQSRKKQSRNLGIAGIFVGGWTLIVPSIVRSYNADNYHDEILNDFTEKLLPATPILPGMTASGLIFVSVRDFKPNSLTVTIKNAKNETQVLSVGSTKLIA